MNWELSNMPALEDQPTDGTTDKALFLSYAREDRKRAIQIIRALETSGYSVWWDGLLESGARFSDLTEQALNTARAVVVLWSATSVSSHWVNDEATSGRDSGRLVPISIDGTSAPIGFRQFQVINLAKWRGNPKAPEFDRVLRGIAALPERPCNSTGPTTPLAPQGMPSVIWTARRPTRRGLLIAGGATVAAAGAAGLWRWGAFGSGAATDPSIAVLPFENISGDPAKDYFAAGLSAELRAQLASNMALRVIAQASSEAFEDGDDSAVAKATRLGVAYLLDGNVRWSGDDVRINAELIDGSTGVTQWSKSFERPMGNIFAVQSEIAAAVTAALTAEMAQQGDRTQDGGTNDVAAYDQYLRGRDLYNRADSEEMDRSALARFDAAIAADSRFAAAHAARARSLAVIGALYGNLAQTRANYAAALVSARRAVALAPGHAESQSTLGYVLAETQLDVRAARPHFDQSRQLGGGDGAVLGRFALFAAQNGRRADALAAIERAVLLDPLNPLIHRAQALVHYAAREYDKALAPFRRALELNPGLGSAHAQIGDALLAMGQPQQAQREYRLESNALLRETGLAIVDHLLGSDATAQAARANIVAGLGNQQVTFYQQAQIAAQWREPDQAIQALTAARAAGDSGLVWARTDPLLDPLRQRPDFARLLSGMHFE